MKKFFKIMTSKTIQDAADQLNIPSWILVLTGVILSAILFQTFDIIKK